MDVKEAIEILKEENCEWFGDRVRIATAEAIEALERTRWIPVSERLPTEDDADKLTGLVLFKRSNGWIHTDYWVAAQDLKDTNTHWMPLPEPPREVES